MSAFTEQVDGTHYKNQVIQPFELAYLVADGDAGFCKFVKYLTRDKGERIINLQKAKHITELTKEVFTLHSKKFPEMTPQTTKILQVATGTLGVPNLDLESSGVTLLVLYTGFLNNLFDESINIIEELIQREKDGS